MTFLQALLWYSVKYIVYLGVAVLGIFAGKSFAKKKARKKTI